MPYGRGTRTATPTPPGIGVGNFAQGQEEYRQLLTGVETREGLQASFVSSCPFFNTFLRQTPLGERTVFFFDAAGGGGTVSQTLGAELANFLGPARATIFVNGGGATSSTAARFEATRGAEAGSLDFNPLNGTIIATSGAGTKAVRTVQVDGSAWHEVTIDFGNAVGVPVAGLWRLTPQIAPSAFGQIEFCAPGIMCMTSTVVNLADVPPLTWIPDTGNLGVDEGPVTNAQSQGRLPALAHNPALLVKKIPDAYQIEGSDLGRILLCSAEAGVNIALPSTAFGTADFSTLPTGWFCYIDCTEIGSGSCLLFDPGAADIIEPWGFDVAGAGSAGVVTSVFLDAYGYGGLFLLMLVSRSGGIGVSPRWRLCPTSAAGTVDLVGAGTFTTPFGVRQLRVTGAGGGGGGGAFFGAISGAGGGSGDAVADFLFPVTSPATAIPFSVGTGGAAGTAGAAGANGTATTFGALNLGGGFGGESTPNFMGGAPGGFLGSQGGTVAIGNIIGDGGDNVAGGVGSRGYDKNVGLYSAAFRGGGGAGGAALPAVDGTPGADGFLIVKW